MNKYRKLPTTILIFCFISFIALTLVGCGEEEPTTVSEQITLSLNMRDSDISANVLSESKNISTETGNPWAAFISSSTDQLGRAPEAFSFTTAEIILNPAESNGVASWDDLSPGRMTLNITDTNGDNPIEIGYKDSPTGTNVKLEITSNKDSFAPMLQAMNDTDFKIELKVETQYTGSFNMKVGVVLQGGAY